MLRRRVPRPVRPLRCAIVAGLGIAIAPLLAIAAGAATGDGMLRPVDVGLERVSDPHRATVIAIDLVAAGSCAPGETEEHTARVQSFAPSDDGASTGAALNQIVYDFASRGAAKSFYAKIRANEQRRVSCAKTDKAAALSYSSAPSGVGDQRFTVAADELINGDVRGVHAVHVLDGAHVHKLVFVDWEDSLASPSTISRHAVDRLP